MSDTECASVWDLVLEEMESRGWDRLEMARRMGGDETLNLCTLDFLSLEDPRIMLGSGAANMLAQAFGTSATLWLNVDQRWREFAKQQAEVEG